MEDYLSQVHLDRNKYEHREVTSQGSVDSKLVVHREEAYN